MQFQRCQRPKLAQSLRQRAPQLLSAQAELCHPSIGAIGFGVCTALDREEYVVEAFCVQTGGWQPTQCVAGLDTSVHIRWFPVLNWIPETGECSTKAQGLCVIVGGEEQVKVGPGRGDCGRQLGSAEQSELWGISRTTVMHRQKVVCLCVEILEGMQSILLK